MYSQFCQWTLQDIFLCLGWGTTEFSGPESDTLQKVNLTIISNYDCSIQLSQMPIFFSQVCTYTPHKDACQFDSGGPLFWHDNQSNRLQQVGIISYGMACASTSPSVNTRVTSYLTWIVSKSPGTSRQLI